MINDQIKKLIVTNKFQVELLQTSITNAIATLIYSEFISRIKQKQIPIRKVLVPSIREVREYTDVTTNFMEGIANNLISDMRSTYFGKKFIDHPDFFLLKEENAEIAELLLRLYILPNISRLIPSIIERKFDLDNNQIIREDRDIRMFTDFNINNNIEDIVKFVAVEASLTMVINDKAIQKSLFELESNIDSQFNMYESTVIKIDNANAISSILYNNEVFCCNPYFIKLLDFVSSTKWESPYADVEIITTGALNAVTVYDIK